MSVFDVTLALWDFNRGRTLGLLNTIAEQPQPERVLGFRPGPSRAPLAWQLMHVGITEELFATERLLGTQPDFADDVPRFRGGSTPDDNTPNIDHVREVLQRSRDHLRNTISRFSEADLAIVPEPLKERGWTLATVLQVLTWHEAHHQGQAHLTYNLWNAGQA